VEGLAAAMRRVAKDDAARAAVAAAGRARALRLFEPSALARELVAFWGEVVARWASR
jgi:glycosyltransferase involved in cell wall biosynthesis